MNTTYLPFSTLVYYCLANIFGFMYVNISNLNFYRKNLLFSFHMWYRDFTLTVIFAPIFYFVSTIVTLRSTTDVASTTCSDVNIESSCMARPYTHWQVFSHNFLAWGTCYVIGL